MENTSNKTSLEGRVPLFSLCMDDTTSFVLGCQALYYKWAPQLRVKWQEFKDVMHLQTSLYD